MTAITLKEAIEQYSIENNVNKSKYLNMLRLLLRNSYTVKLNQKEINELRSEIIMLSRRKHGKFSEDREHNQSAGK